MRSNLWTGTGKNRKMRGKSSVMEPAARRGSMRRIAAAHCTVHTARLDEAWGLKCGRVTQQHQPVLVMHICFELFLPTTTRSRGVGSPENQEGKVIILGLLEERVLLPARGWGIGSFEPT